MPGTHHIRFQVDGQVTTAEDLPTAVDDNGTIANYVAVPLSGNTPPSASAAVLPTPTKENPNNHLPPAISTAVGASFFADAQKTPSGSGSARSGAGTRAGNLVEDYNRRLLAVALSRHSFSCTYFIGRKYDNISKLNYHRG